MGTADPRRFRGNATVEIGCPHWQAGDRVKDRRSGTATLHPRQRGLPRVGTTLATMASTEVDQRLEAGLARVARMDGRSIDDVRQEAIRRYLVERGLHLLERLGSTSPGAALTDVEADRIAADEVAAARREGSQ